MSVTDVLRVPWAPLTEEDREAVRTSLREVLNSPQFSSSKRYPALLEYLVEQALAGHADQIKERTIGVEVFGRPADYDTNTDTAVRYSAGEVRKRLPLYYHAHENSPIQIVLSNRSYVPEFVRIETPQHRDTQTVSSCIEDRAVARLIAELRTVDKWRRTALSAIALLALVLIAFGLSWARSVLHPDPLVGFWGPILDKRQTSLICPGGVVFSSDSISGIKVADQSVSNPFLSFGSSLAVGRVAAVLNADGGQYRVQSAASTTLAQITDGPVVLIGAYNNKWTQRFLSQLRFHFQQHPLEQIVDTANPGRVWERDASKPFDEGTDYAIVARFRETSTANMIVVLAGLQRFGTDAASQFVVNPGLLEELNSRVGADWRHKNIEVVLKVDVVGGRAGAPQIEDVSVF